VYMWESGLMLHFSPFSPVESFSPVENFFSTVFGFPPFVDNLIPLFHN
jgi:hypothetical protein